MTTTTLNDEHRIIQLIIADFPLPITPDETVCDALIGMSLKNGDFLSSLGCGVRIRNKIAKKKRNVPFLETILKRVTVVKEQQICSGIKARLETLEYDITNFIVVVKHTKN